MALFELLQAPVRWQLLRVSLENGLLDTLAQPVTAASLAQQYRLDERCSGLLLRALCSMGVVDNVQQQFQLTAEARRYLHTSSDQYIGGTLLNMADTRHRGLEQLAELLAGECPAQPLQLDAESHWQRASESLLAFHRSLATERMLPLLQQQSGWQQCLRVLDLGAGSESLALALCADNPARQVTLLDLPGCIEQIARRLQGHPLLTQIQLLPGDYNHCSFAPTTPDTEPVYDLIWSSMTLYYARDLVEFMTKVRASLAPGGRFISVHEGLTDNRCQPPDHVIGRLIPALHGPDLSFEKGEIRNAMQQAGFDVGQPHTLVTPWGPMEVDIAINPGV